jgi:molecular chaperone GrpE
MTFKFFRKKSMDTTPTNGLEATQSLNSENDSKTSETLDLSPNSTHLDAAAEVQSVSEGLPLDALLTQIKELQSLADNNHQNYLRTYADLENYRKRALKDKEDFRKSLIFSFLNELAPILDNFQLGLSSLKPESDAQTILKGFQMIAGQFEGFLKNYGVEAISPEKQVFDPNLHESIAYVAHAEIPENYIIQTVRKGYKIQDRLIRPANVVVSSGAEKISEVDTDV